MYVCVYVYLYVYVYVCEGVFTPINVQLGTGGEAEKGKVNR